MKVELWFSEPTQYSDWRWWMSVYVNEKRVAQIKQPVEVSCCKTRRAAFSAARRVAKQLNLEVEE